MSGYNLWMTVANVHGEVVGEGRTKDLKNHKDILRMTEPRLGLKGVNVVAFLDRKVYIKA